MRLRVTVAMLLIMSFSASADSIDDYKAKRDGVSVEQLKIDRLQAQVDSLNEKLKAAGDKIASLSSELDKSKLETARLQGELRAAQPKLPADKPSGKAGQDDSSIVNVPQMEATGQDYDKKYVKMLGVTIHGVESASWTDGLPEGTEKSFIHAFVRDEEGRAYMGVFANREHFGKQLTSVRAGDKFNIKGLVVRLNDPNKTYGIICSDIELVSAK